MALTSAGAQALAQKAIGQTVADFTYLAVGSGTTAFAISQTALVTEHTNGRKAAAPIRNGAILTYTGQYITTDAVGDWEEWGTFNATSGGTMLGRKVETLGTKPNTQAWTFEATVTFSAA
jgi:hypothetical protein